MVLEEAEAQTGDIMGDDHPKATGSGIEKRC
jgi:hypothetical protein